MKPRLLDLFCGEGGAGRGYQLAGFHVTGVDIVPQPRYAGDDFLQADAMDVLNGEVDGFDVIHASPPCQHYSQMSNCRPGLKATYPDLVAPVRERLQASGLPWVIENVPGAPMRPDLILCGCLFGLRSPRGLGVRRKRWFELHPAPLVLISPCTHEEPALPVTGHSPGKEWRIRMAEFGEAPGIEERRQAMGVPWMSRNGTTEAIPPAFTEFIGSQLLEQLERAA